MTTDTSLVTFKAISTFVTELAETFGDDQHSLKLYGRLVEKTTLAHDEPIRKHIAAFASFCRENREALTHRDAKQIETAVVKYSDKVCIDIKSILVTADRDTQSVIWEHLLCISALVDPAGKAKELLKQTTDGKSTSNEANFITDIIDKVESHVDPNANPMEAVTKIMQSGVFNDLIGSLNSGVSDGSLDMGKLMGTVQSMVGQMGGGQPGQPNPMEMLTSMMGAMGGPSPGFPPPGLPGPK